MEMLLACTVMVNSGSGVVVQHDAQGTYVLASHHQIALSKNKSVTVRFRYGERYAADVVKSKSEGDICLLRIRDPLHPRIAVRCAKLSRRAVEKGDPSNMIAYRNVAGESPLRGACLGRTGKLFAADFDAKPGDSGSPVYNERNELVGIVSLRAASRPFCTDIESIRDFLGVREDQTVVALGRR